MLCVFQFPQVRRCPPHHLNLPASSPSSPSFCSEPKAFSQPSSPPAPSIFHTAIWRGEVDRHGPTALLQAARSVSLSSCCWENRLWESPAWCCASSKASSTSTKRAPSEVREPFFHMCVFLFGNVTKPLWCGLGLFYSQNILFLMGTVITHPDPLFLFSLFINTEIFWVHGKTFCAQVADQNMSEELIPHFCCQLRHEEDW